ncbi:MAG TPA: lytic murein transglycosylase [Candidatus Paceibacterota bacterium]|jgi:membrane-bound lytic murein transglycosylase B|nr:lytic murein transglycosylase [Candidatus Paceibacterota bacterium]
MSFGQARSQELYLMHFVRNYKSYIALGLLSALLAGSLLTQPVSAQVDPQREAELQAQLDEVEKEIAQQSQILAGQQQQSASYSRDISILDTQIKQAQLQIQAKTIEIAKLGKDIDLKTLTINELSDKIDSGKESLSQLLRKTDQLDSSSMVEVMLSDTNLSSFFEDLDSFDQIEKSMKVSFDAIEAAKSDNEEQKNTLHTQQDAATAARAEISAQQAIINQKEKEKQQLLADSKNKEKTYEQTIKAKQTQAAQIRAALFALRDTQAIPFGDALNYANEASKATGVRPAFILAILQQESNLGANVGQCYLKNDTTGAGIGKNTGTPFSNVMSPTRDVPPFLALAAQLGFDPHNQVVSCPQGVGWGGAMGPSQFIASTWTGLAGRIAAATGSAVPNPWNARDAFFATAIFLSDLGARNGTQGEIEAAGRYYAGGNWATLGMSYAQSVQQRAQTIQTTMIDPLQGL